MIELGTIVKDKITGFVGTATAYVTYITGCNQYLVTPRCDKQNKMEDGYWLDEDRIEVLKEPKVELSVVNAGPCDTPPVR